MVAHKQKYAGDIEKINKGLDGTPIRRPVKPFIDFNYYVSTVNVSKNCDKRKSLDKLSAVWYYST